MTDPDSAERGDPTPDADAPDAAPTANAEGDTERAAAERDVDTERAAAERDVDTERAADAEERPDRDAAGDGRSHEERAAEVADGADAAESTPGADRQDHSGPAITVADLRKRFGDVTVLDGVSLDVERGTVVAVVGPNGSGKTTLLQVAAGVLAPTGGRVTVEAGAVRPVGYLPQQPSFRPGFTVEDTLTFYRQLLGPEVESSPTVDEVLASVGLKAARNRRVEALSGGMTRLLGVAQALLGDPPVLVLDEPASGLDPAMSAHIFRTIDDVAGAGRAVLMASHDLAGVERTADRVCLLDRGGVVLDDDPATLVAEAGVDDLVDVFLDAVAADGDAEGPAPSTVRTGTGGERG